MKTASCTIPPPDQIAPDHPFARERDKPILIWDGECGFCKLWVDYWQKLTGNTVQYAPYQQVSRYFPDIAPEKFAEAIHFITPNGTIFTGAHAAFKVISDIPGKHWYLRLYEKVPGVSWVADAFYEFVADRRTAAYHVTRWLWGKEIPITSFILTRWVFLRVLGIIYLIAFLSWWRQSAGLIGSGGLLPISQTLTIIRDNLGLERFWYFPTLAWLNSSDAFMHALPLVGAGLSVLVIVGIAVAPALILSWLLYLSIATAGQEFMSFQWDIMLLEVGFLAILLAPWRLLPKLSRQQPPSFLVVWLFRLLVFRLMLSSGIVKLASGDPTWRNFTALTYHYETQPLPNPLAWYFHQLPAWFHQFSVGITFFVQLVFPFLIFLPRRGRYVAAAGFATLEILILATGNYTFFNLLTLALLLFLLDDTILKRVLPRRLHQAAVSAQQAARKLRWRPIVLGVIATPIIAIGLLRVLNTVYIFPPLVTKALNLTSPPRIVNGYGLFAVMTTSRPEIIIEGSDDGKTWHAYEFKYKPGDVNRRPPQVAPYQPRLDWQMWFAALRANATLPRPSFDPWFVNLVRRLLEGAPDVLALVGNNPFPDAPPKYIRATLYDYHFTDAATKRAEHAWWQRDYLSIYLPPLTLENFQQR